MEGRGIFEPQEFFFVVKYTTTLFGVLWVLLPRPSRETLREGGMGQQKLTIEFNALAG